MGFVNVEKITLAKQIVKKRWSEHHNATKDSKPARHLSKPYYS